MLTVLVYLAATVASGFSWNPWSLPKFRFVMGLGIGGEYAAANATIQELIPARKRGFTDLCINGSHKLGAALGAVGVLNEQWIGPEWVWRLAFVVGDMIGLGVLFLRQFIQENPRW